MAGVSLPPSAKKILRILGRCSELSHKDLVRLSDLSPRTVRYGIRKLKDQHLVVQKLNMRDLRQLIYLARTGNAGRDAERAETAAQGIPAASATAR